MRRLFIANFLHTLVSCPAAETSSRHTRNNLAGNLIPFQNGEVPAPRIGLAGGVRFPARAGGSISDGLRLTLKVKNERGSDG